MGYRFMGLVSFNHNHNCFLGKTLENKNVAAYYQLRIQLRLDDMAVSH